MPDPSQGFDEVPHLVTMFGPGQGIDEIPQALFQAIYHATKDGAPATSPEPASAPAPCK